MELGWDVKIVACVVRRKLGVIGKVRNAKGKGGARVSFAFYHLSYPSPFTPCLLAFFFFFFFFFFCFFVFVLISVNIMPALDSKLALQIDK